MAQQPFFAAAIGFLEPAVAAVHFITANHEAKLGEPGRGIRCCQHAVDAARLQIWRIVDSVQPVSSYRKQIQM
jgi:hypothetical protein